MPHPSHELPIRSKLEMVNDIVRAVHCLHMGDRKKAEPFLDDLKIRSIYLDEKVQQDALIFSEQVYFQFDYDPWHKVTPEVQRAADRLIEDLGFSLLKEQ